MKKVKSVVFGYGFLGKWHAEKAFEESELVAIVEPYAANQQAAREKYKNIEICADFRQLKTDFDAAIIVTPTSLHFDVCRELIKLKKHVFCEKPVCSTLEQALELKGLLQKNPVVFQVGHSERCHQIWENFGKIHEFSKTDFIEINRSGQFKGRATDVDVTIDLMIHDIDLVHYLTGAKFKTLSAWGEKSRSSNWDQVIVTGKLDNGIGFIMKASRDYTQEVRTFAIAGKNGTTIVDLLVGQVVKSSSTDVLPFTKRDHLRIEQQKFYDSILNKSKVFVSIDDGISAMAVLKTISESLKNQKEEKVIYP